MPATSVPGQTPRFTGHRRRLAWVCPLLGVWTIIAVWTVSGAEATTATVLTNVIAGTIVLLLGLAAMAPMFTSRIPGRRSQHTNFG